MYTLYVTVRQVLLASISQKIPRVMILYLGDTSYNALNNTLCDIPLAIKQLDFRAGGSRGYLKKSNTYLHIYDRRQTFSQFVNLSTN